MYLRGKEKRGKRLCLALTDRHDRNSRRGGVEIEPIIAVQCCSRMATLLLRGKCPGATALVLPRVGLCLSLFLCCGAAASVVPAHCLTRSTPSPSLRLLAALTSLDMVCYPFFLWRIDCWMAVLNPSIISKLICFLSVMLCLYSGLVNLLYSSLLPSSMTCSLDPNP